MKTPGSVLLLLWAAVVAKESKDLQETCQPDIHTVLREMSALVVEQRVELRYTKTQVEAMETRLRASEKTVEEQRAVIQELKEKQEEQAAAVRAVGGRVNLTGSQVEELRREREERRVAFSASLVASEDVTTGPFNTHTNLVYRHVLTNIGNAYNPNTGAFTAPVRGVYYFDVFVFGNGHASTPTGVSLHKNGEHVVLAYSAGNVRHVAASNGASLLLEVGDVVYLKLWHHAWVRDNPNHHTTFSGHLLFTM
ncbi:complement C1q-like protein 2 [Alosa sapidissima]|uniref:complement C1q-like protein 2 n=1 Tax=Alosa sapidissima TaxID=34773 RepID=UPI001C087660|nr:complement C1q-like protein 2 [Alosa sapidissima]